MNFRLAVVAAMATTMLLVTPFLPSVVAEGEEGTYGAYHELRMEDIDEFMESLTGMTVQEILDMLFQAEGYDIHLKPAINSGLAVKRVTDSDKDSVTIRDMVSGYLEFDLSGYASGSFPKAGHYEAADGEDSNAFIERVFTKTPDRESRMVDATTSLSVYVDLESETYIDRNTGEYDDTSVSMKVVILNDGSGNINIQTDEDGLTMDIAYEKYEESNNGYVSLGLELTSDGIKVLSEEESWECRPTINSHFAETKVSSDFAGNVWTLFRNAIGLDEKERLVLPELILNIIRSTNRTLDLFDTLNSLTSTKFSDLVFTGDFKMSKGQDEYGNEYVQVSVNSGEEISEMKFWLGAYTLDVANALAMVPSDIVSEDDKLLLGVALAVVGLDTIYVGDISWDTVTEKKINEISSKVDREIERQEVYDFKMPLAYLAVAIAILVLGIGAAVYMWRCGE